MPDEKKGPVTELEESLVKLDSDCKRLQQDYLRALADFDNYRRRVERDLEANQRIALESLLVDLLPVLDNFERAVAAAEKEAAAGNVRKGIELIHRQLRDVVCKHGVADYSCIGQEFDPRNAEAIGYVESAEHAPNTVVTEACKGYTCQGKVLRPARVIVARPKDSGVEEIESGAVETERE
jgi:molecular chaperone GrpE